MSGLPESALVEVGRDQRPANPVPLAALVRAGESRGRHRYPDDTSGEEMSEIQRYGSSRRWADVVVHRGVAHWVEVAEDMSLDARGQIAQVLAQIDSTLECIKSDRTQLLQILVYLGDEHDTATLNEAWDAWVPAAHPPVRAMVQVGLGKRCKVEMVVTAAVPEG
jgi:enamine deaminase RidA (YjgF/YER057c/UK114 family)